MRKEIVKEVTSQRFSATIRSRQPNAAPPEPVHSQPVSPCDDLQVRIARRAYEIHAERGYQQGYELDDWLEAEREILGSSCNA